jgi:uncharacterized membrane protein
MATESQIDAASDAMPKLPFAAAVVALIGVADALYLTVHHYTAEPVPCSIVEGCETVLTSSYATIGNIPLAAFGAAAYFLAFSLALLAGFGNRVMWGFFGIQVILMSLFTAWLIYIQAAVIGAFCQFCLISAATTLTLLIIFIISKLRGRN